MSYHVLGDNLSSLEAEESLSLIPEHFHQHLSTIVVLEKEQSLAYRRIVELPHLGLCRKDTAEFFPMFFDEKPPEDPVPCLSVQICQTACLKCSGTDETCCQELQQVPLESTEEE